MEPPSRPKPLPRQWTEQELELCNFLLDLAQLFSKRREPTKGLADRIAEVAPPTTNGPRPEAGPRPPPPAGAGPSGPRAPGGGGEALPALFVAECELCWIECDECGQWTTLERGHSYADQRWRCHRNTWNPELARCVTEAEFRARWEAFCHDTGRSAHKEPYPFINRIPINLWSLYNLVTQLGGWDTVSRNRWVGHLLKSREEWAPLSWQPNSISRLTAIYVDFLLPYEKAYFAGKRYARRFDKWLLWRTPDEPLGETAVEQELRRRGSAAALDRHFIAAGYVSAKPASLELRLPPDGLPVEGALLSLSVPLFSRPSPSAGDSPGRPPSPDPHVDLAPSERCLSPQCRDFPGNRRQQVGDREMVWLQCCRCGQRALLEVGHTVEDEDAWVCAMNTWNPNMAHCMTSKEFMARLKVLHARSKGKDGEPLMDNLPKVRGEPLDLWWFYNVITQMGGWNTVFSNTWLRWVYRQREEWAGMTDIGNRLKVAYLTFLYPYEVAYFRGKPYSTPEERDLLWHPRRRRSLARGRGGRWDIVCSASPSTAAPTSPDSRRGGSCEPADDTPEHSPSSSATFSRPDLSAPSSSAGPPASPAPAPSHNGLGPGLDRWRPGSAPPSPADRRRRAGSPNLSEAGSEDSSVSSNYVPAGFPRGRPSRKAELDLADRDARPRKPCGRLVEVVDITKFELGWVSCDLCGQWSIIERGAPMPDARQRWQCGNNRTNPTLARCVQRAEFLKELELFWNKTDFSPEDPAPEIAGQPVDLWELYNMMTQLGGFDTVTANTWWFVFTKDQPSWAAMRGSVLRLKGIYRHYLLHYEREHFRGKRYETPDEVMALWRDNSKGALGGPLPGQEGYCVPMTDKKVIRKYVTEEEENPVGRRGRKQGGVLLHCTADVELPLVERVPIQSQVEGELGWAECERCGQRATVEVGHAIPPPRSKWRCSQNRWNPAMGVCVREEEFDRGFNDWWYTRYKDDNIIYRVPDIRSEKVSLWYIYNMVTQLGGWATVWGNGWLPVIYREKPSWASLTSIGNKMKQIYLKFLYAYEQEFFKGKRYDTAKEGAKLWRRGGPLGLGALSPSLKDELEMETEVEAVRKRPREEFDADQRLKFLRPEPDPGLKVPEDRPPPSIPRAVLSPEAKVLLPANGVPARPAELAGLPPPAELQSEWWDGAVEVGRKVWVRCENGIWFPGKVIPFTEPRRLSRETKALLCVDRQNSVLVHLYGSHMVPYRSAPKKYRQDAIHPWGYDVQRKKQVALSVPELVLAISEAEEDID